MIVGVPSKVCTTVAEARQSTEPQMFDCLEAESPPIGGRSQKKTRTPKDVRAQWDVGLFRPNNDSCSTGL